MTMTHPIDTAAIARAVDLLRSGGIVAIPTETVYGLAADADNRDAVMATFAAKGRPTDHPLIVHVASAQALPFWASHVPESARVLTRAFWPGPLTIVLPKSDRCGTFVTGGQDTVAIRCPAHPWTQALLAAFSGSTHKGLTAPSANTFGRISPTCAQHVADDLGVKPTGVLDAILDGGPCSVGVESTIVNLSGAHPEILRHGAITRAMLEAVLGCPVPDAGSNAPRASGRLKSHYAPQTRLQLVSQQQWSAHLQQLGEMPVALMAPAHWPVPEAHVVLRLTAPETPAEYAHTLYEALHRLDAAGAARIVIALPPQTPEWAHINDRLARAAADKN